MKLTKILYELGQIDPENPRKNRSEKIAAIDAVDILLEYSSDNKECWTESKCLMINYSLFL